MPIALVSTNATLTPDAKQVFIKAMSGALTEATGKPEAFCMVSLNCPVPMCMAGNPEQLCCFIDFRSIGCIDPFRNKKTSKIFCDVVQTHLKVQSTHCYINFQSVERANWGFNGDTF